MKIHWSFLDRDVEVLSIGEKVAYSWTCNDVKHNHVIECLWIWHKCTMELDPIRAASAKRIDDVAGWQPAGVGKHDLVSVDPLHTEPSIFWPSCCGMHGWIRNGLWENA